MNNPVLQLISVQIKSFLREPGVLFWAIGFPVLMAWILGIAFTQKIESRRTVMMTGDIGTEMKNSFEELLAADIGSPTRIKFIYGTNDEAVSALRKGEISLYVETSPGQLTFHFDPNNPEAQNTYLIIDREFRKRREADQKSKIVKVHTPGSRYIDFLLPGLIAMGIMNSCIWGISWTLIDYRIKKLLRRMIATPMRKSDFLVAQFATRLLITVIEAAILFGFGYFYFNVTITGSFTALTTIFLAGLISFSGMAILVSSRVSNTEIANGIINAVTLPMMILSGIFFSYQNFPEWALPIIKALPLTMLADGLRTVVTEGTGIAGIITPSVILILQGIAFFYAGLKIYKWH
ncbi:MAG: ABC transporter permease [Cytophagaceae bacterium]